MSSWTKHRLDLLLILCALLAGVLCFETVHSCVESCRCDTNCSYCRLSETTSDKEEDHSVTFVCLTDSDYRRMGQNYGRVIKVELHETLDVLKHWFLAGGVPYDELVAQAAMFQRRYSANYTEFLKVTLTSPPLSLLVVKGRNLFARFLHGLADGAGFSFDDATVLNGMETVSGFDAGCLFAFLPPSMGGPLVLRNYDYSRPFHMLARRLVVTMIRHPDTTPTAIIGMPGQVLHHCLCVAVRVYICRSQRTNKVSHTI